MYDPVKPFRPLARTGAIVAGWALVALSVLTGIEVLARKFFGASLQGVDEIGGYVLAATSSIGFTWALLQRSHTRVDLFIQHAPARLKTAANLATTLALAALAMFLFHRAYLVVAETILYKSQASTPLRTPLIWPQSVWLAGFGLFALVAVLAALHAIGLLLARRTRDFNRLYGPRDAKDEIAEELASYRDPASKKGSI